MTGREGGQKETAGVLDLRFAILDWESSREGGRGGEYIMRNYKV